MKANQDSSCGETSSGDGGRRSGGHVVVKVCGHIGILRLMSNPYLLYTGIGAWRRGVIRPYPPVQNIDEARPVMSPSVDGRSFNA